MLLVYKNSRNKTKPYHMWSTRMNVTKDWKTPSSDYPYIHILVRKMIRAHFRSCSQAGGDGDRQFPGAYLLRENNSTSVNYV